MGVFRASLFVLLIALGTPLLYRQYADENTVNFMTKYYSNYKMIDQFLRRFATHIDGAKNYVPDSHQLKGAAVKLNEYTNSLLEMAKSKLQSGTVAQDETKGTAAKAQQKRDSNHQVTLSSCPGEDVKVQLWTKEELIKYDGSLAQSEVYLGFLGLVYNVTINSQHYAPGAEYNVFAGRDATRAFVTGNFTHDLTDDIRDIDESLYSHIESWASFYSASYQMMGRIVGAFFDSHGCSTPELNRVHQVFIKLATERGQQNEREKSMPECNSEYNGETKQGRVWCTDKSGGIERAWAGVPRLYDNGEVRKCVCVNLDLQQQETYEYLNVYPNCKPEAGECNFT